MMHAKQLHFLQIVIQKTMYFYKSNPIVAGWLLLGNIYVCLRVLNFACCRQIVPNL